MKITLQKDGPYLVEKGIDVVDWNGRPYPIQQWPAALCRCGASKSKPFCDGTHVKIHFQASEAAPT